MNEKYAILAHEDCDDEYSLVHGGYSKALEAFEAAKILAEKWDQKYYVVEVLAEVSPSSTKVEGRKYL